MRVLRVLVFVCLVGLTVACDVKVGKDGDVSIDVASGKASDEWKRSYTLASGGRLEIINSFGRIEVFPATGTQVDVIASREVQSRTEEESKARLASVQMTEDVGPNRVAIEARSNGDSIGQRGRVLINYRVNIPAGLTTMFRTENGSVTLQGVAGQITAAATNGRIVGRGLSGAVDASTVNGPIEVEIVSLTADSKIVTVNGPATLIVAPTLGAELEAMTVNGGVTIDTLPLNAGERTERRVSGRLNGGGPRITIQTTNGRVRIRARG